MSRTCSATTETSGDEVTKFDDLQRDEVYRALCLAITEAGQDRESLYLARLALLLAEQVGDATRCLTAIAEAGRGLPTPSMSR